MTDTKSKKHMSNVIFVFLCAEIYFQYSN